MLNQIAEIFCIGLFLLLFVACLFGGGFLVVAGGALVIGAVFGGVKVGIGFAAFAAFGMLLLGIFLFGTAVRILTR